jgi:2-dehydro-3-deoxygluconokinase
MTANVMDLLAVGETMVVVTPTTPAPLSTAATYVLRPGGAESNVAVHLARLGHRTAWFSAVGDDPFGTIILEHLAGIGVDTSHVITVPGAHTGIYFKHVAEGRSRMFYYRAGSAASTLGPWAAAGIADVPARVIHLTGVTPALSDDCAELIRELMATRVRESLVSFDVNFRPALWTAADAAPVLRELASHADIVFVGLDEAHDLWGAAEPADVRRILPRPRILVVKDAANGATEFGPADSGVIGNWHEPTPAAVVVEAIGAGDAFAAGWLSGMLRGFGPPARLTLGHRVAAQVLGTTADDVDFPADLVAGLADLGVVREGVRRKPAEYSLAPAAVPRP